MSKPDTDRDRQRRDADARALGRYCESAGLSPQIALTIAVNEMAKRDHAETAKILRDLANAIELLHAETPGEAH